MPLFETDIGTIDCTQSGEGGERIIALHCAGSGPGSLTTLATSLQTPGRMVIVPALNGYAHTKVSGTDAIAEHVAVVNWVVNHYANGATSVSLFGHSMGGLVALLVAQAQSSCDNALVYDPIAPNVLDTSDETDNAALTWDREIVITLRDAVASGEHERGVSQFIEAWNDTPWHRLPEPIRKALIRSAPHLAREIYSLSYQDLHDLGDAQARSARSITLLTGESSPLVAGRMVARLAERFPDADVVKIAAAGHMYPVTHGKQLATRIDRALERSSAQT